jgi:hypothetical protein
VIGLPARLVQLAGPVEVVARRRGTEAAVAVARRHRGTQFDPAVVDLFCSRAPDLLDGLDRASDWDAILGTEPQLSRRVAGADLDQVLDAMADLVDLKSPYLAGHSRGGVASLAAAAAQAGGESRGAHLRQARRIKPRRRDALRDSAWADGRFRVRHLMTKPYGPGSEPVRATRLTAAPVLDPVSPGWYPVVSGAGGGSVRSR